MTQGGDEGRHPYGPSGQGFPPPPPPRSPEPGQQFGGYGSYPQPPYGQAPWAPPGYGGMPPVDLASWGERAGALILDGIFSLLLFLPGGVLFVVGAVLADDGNEGAGTALIAAGSVLMLVAFVVQVWNQGWRQGAVGWSWGKQVLKIKLVRATDAQPPGGGIGLGRLLLRSVLGSVTLGVYTPLTYLWPLWDQKNQTLDDKILNTLVVRAR